MKLKNISKFMNLFFKFKNLKILDLSNNDIEFLP